MPGARASKRGLGHIHAYRVGAGLGQHRSELAGAATQIERPVAGTHSTQQEIPALIPIRRLEVLGQVRPKLLVVVAHSRDRTAGHECAARSTVPRVAPAAVILPAGGASSDPTVEALERQTLVPGRILVVGPQTRLSDAIETAAESDPAWVWLLDAGVVPEPPALAQLLGAAARTEPAPVLVASKVLAPDGTLDPASTPVPEVHSGDRVLAALEQHTVPLRVARRGSLLVQHDAVRSSGALGSFDRDLEWTARLLSRQPGVLEPASVAVRTNASATGGRPGLLTTLRLLAALEPRERLWFAARFAEQALAARRRGARA